MSATTQQNVQIAKLSDHAKNAEIVTKINELIDVINTMRTDSVKNIESTRAMTEDDARRVMLGDMVNLSHGDAAKALGLSYGQIYSARKGFTFKPIYKLTQVNNV